MLESIKNAVPSNWRAKVEELKSLAAIAPAITLSDFLRDSGLELEDIYAGNRSWSDLCEEAKLPVLTRGPHEEALRRACSRMLHIDDPLRLAYYQQVLRESAPPALAQCNTMQKRLLRMLVASVANGVLQKTDSLTDALQLLWNHPQVRAELLALFAVLSERIQHISQPFVARPNVPLSIHGRYTRLEILAAFALGEFAKVHSWQTGVYWAKDEKTDLLAFTLDKKSSGFSPTTRYLDYAISRERIHWESQSATRANSETGQRYQHHQAQGSVIALFARLNAGDEFYFLGPAKYVSHESELPMKITWQLAHALPGDLFAAFAAAVA